MHEKTLILEALSLRAWTLQVLSGDLDDSSQGAVTPWLRTYSQTAWALFLNTERCALPLRTVISSTSGSMAALDTSKAAIERRSQSELLRVLLARRQCEQIGRIAREHGWTISILKGGRSILDATGAVDVNDLDLFPIPSELQAVQRTLLKMGYSEIDRGSSHRLPTLAREGNLPIEVHYAIPGVEPFQEVWSRAYIRGDNSGYWDLSPTDHIWNLLVHAVIQHPDRRGCIRDLVLTAKALNLCSGVEIAEVKQRIASNPFSEPLSAFLEMALQMQQGKSIIDQFKITAATRYLTNQILKHRRVPPILAQLLEKAIYARVGGRRINRVGWLDPGIGLERPSSLSLLRSHQQKAPKLIRQIRLLLRSAPIWIFAPTAAYIQRQARVYTKTIEDGDQFHHLPI